MAQDATGTPTSLGIPKYNTAVDAPSGKGFNAAIDVIDGLIAARIAATLIDAKGDLIAGSAADTAARLAVGADGTFLKADSSQATGLAWGAAGAPGFGTALPGSPADGDQFILVDSTSAPTYSWLFRYVSAKASNKWVFLGGAPGFAQVLTSENVTSTTYHDLATAGPSFALPVAGDYMVAIGCEHGNFGGDIGRMSYAIGGTGATDADSIVHFTNAGAVSTTHSIAGERLKTGLTAVTLTAKYKSTTGSSRSFANRWMRVTPRAVGG